MIQTKLPPENPARFRSLSLRGLAVLTHRWVGLTIAAFLFLSGVTGAVISWDHELDDWLNPHLHMALGQGQAQPSLDLVSQVEARDPRAQVTYVPLAPQPGEALALFVQPRVDPATGGLFELGYNQIFLDPVTWCWIDIGHRKGSVVDPYW